MKIKRARHKTGRDKISTSFSIPQSQINWLNEHPEINQSQLVSSLLAEYLEAIKSAQSEKIKLILKLRALKTENEKAEKEMNRSEREFNDVRNTYSSKIEHFENLRYIAQLPLEQLKISFDELNNPGIAWVSDKNSKKKFDTQNVTVIHKGLKEPAQIHAKLSEQLKFAEGAEYKTKLEKLKQDIELPESIYKAFKEKYENITKQIGDIERLIVKND